MSKQLRPADGDAPAKDTWLRSLDGVDRGRLVVALLAIVALIAAVAYLGTKDFVSKPMNINGDSLGMEAGEALSDYTARADETLQQAEGTRWALVTFSAPLSLDEVGTVIDADGFTATRVSAAVPVDFTPYPLPEPVGSATRAQVLAQQAENNDIDAAIAGVVLYSDSRDLRAIDEVEGVLSVEVAPAGAAWGRLGIRPVAATEASSRE